MVSASHQFCLGLFVPLPDNPQSIFLEYWCALALFPLAAVTLALQGAMFQWETLGSHREACGYRRGRVFGQKHPSSSLVPSDPSYASRPGKQ